MAMNDEERALGIVNWAFLHTHEKWAMKMAIKRAFAADEREKCAKIADGDLQEIPENQSLTSAVVATASNIACRRIAAAIRAMGDKG